MPSGETIALILAAGLGGGGISTVATKWLGRNVDDAQAATLRAQAAASDVDTLRAVIAEVREAEAKKAQRIDQLEKRLEKLEERERHALTRAAVHEAWDQLSFSALLAQNPQHPPPPPLAIAEDD